MSTITKDQVIDALAKVVEKYGPDTKYVDRAREDGKEMTSGGQPWSCSYVHESPEGDMRPGCIVGVVLHEEFDVPLGQLAAPDRNTVGVRLLAYQSRGQEWLPDFTADAIETLARAQSSQDYGETWGTALIHARGEW